MMALRGNQFTPRASHAAETVAISNNHVCVKPRKTRSTLEERLTTALLGNRKWQYFIFLFIAFVLHQIAYEARKKLNGLIKGGQMLDHDIVHTG